MAHGSGHSFAYATAVAVLALTPAAVPAQASTDDPLVTVTDGCGRVDSLEIDSSGTYWLELLPDGKAPKLPKTEASDDTDGPLTEDELAAQRGLLEIGATWTRPMDASKAYTAIRVLEWDDGRFRYLPLVMAGDDAGVRGTDTFKLTNEDCVLPLEPTFTDEDGSEGDTVTIPQVKGVKYSGKPGTTPGKGRVTITATADKGYRLAHPDGTPLAAEDSTWTYSFDGTGDVSVPEAKEPVFRIGAAIPATKKKPAGRAPNVVIVRHVPGVQWIVGGKPAKTSEKQPIVEVPVGDKTSVEVEATSADPKKFALSGTTEWEVAPSEAAKAALPHVAVPTSAVSVGASTVSWAAPADFPAGSRYNVRYRVITLTGNQVRAAAPWRPWFQETATTRAVMRGRPGTIAEVQVQAVRRDRNVSPWSSAATVWFPYDIAKAPNKAWKVGAERAAIGRTMLTSTRRTAGWKATTPTTNRIMLWFGTSPTGAPAIVYVDGKRVATVNTRSKATTARQVLKPIPVLWGRHVVTVVHAGKNGQTLRLDGVAYGR